MSNACSNVPLQFMTYSTQAYPYGLGTGLNNTLASYLTGLEFAHHRPFSS
jgi:hypothetical protein